VQGEQGRAAPGRQGSKAYLVASFGAQACALLRYTLLARLLGPEQLGIAVALILTAQFFESVTDSGGDRFLVQDRRGNEPEVQGLVHLVWLVRGALIAGALALLAVPLARFYGEPQLVTGFLILAIAPLIAGLAHLDYRRTQRTSDFRGEARVLLLSELAALLVTAIAAWLLRDFTAILYGLVVRSAMIVIVSRLVATRRYRAGYSADDAKRLAAFAWPLMLNGLLLFFGSQGDRLLIGKQVGLTELGYYSAALLLIFYPTGILQRVVTTMHLPLIAAASNGPARHAAADRLAGQTSLLTILMLVGFTAVAPPIIPLIFGADFRQPAYLIALIAILQTSRFLRLWPVTIALSLGRSRTVLVSNLLRLLAFPFAFAAMTIADGLLGILIGFTLAEALALLVTLLLVSRHLKLPLFSGLGRLLAFVLCSALALACATAVEHGSAVQIAASAAALLVLLAVLLFRERQTLAGLLALAKRR
jgi:O-antigen/teichoic acid export membrane protein